MSLFPHTVTIYTVLTEMERETFTEKRTNCITILRGVLMDAAKGVDVRTGGLDGADVVTLYIPETVAALDPDTGEAKQFAGPWEFEKMADKSGYWTISINGSAGQTFFIKGEIVEPRLDFGKIHEKFDNVYNVTNVDYKDFGGLAHWEVSGA
jgi:hypothetical protein